MPSGRLSENWSRVGSQHLRGTAVRADCEQQQTATQLIRVLIGGYRMHGVSVFRAGPAWKKNHLHIGCSGPIGHGVRLSGCPALVGPAESQDAGGDGMA